jgi:phosphoribosylamine--glycine ligase
MSINELNATASVLVVGGGGREHAIVDALSRSARVAKIYCAPGNAGIAEQAECVPLKDTDVDGLLAFAKANQIDLTVVGPEAALAAGIVDKFRAAGLKIFGHTQAATAIESSKDFAKRLMAGAQVPTAAYRTFTDFDKALAYVKAGSFPTVIKYDGLAAGKGVVVAPTLEEAEAALRDMLLDGRYGEGKVVIEEFLTGPEISVLSFTDGHTVIPMVSSMDHKRAGEGDTGLNTGGMGTLAPNPCYTPAVAEVCMNSIFLPTIRAMREEGRPFKGCLYFGLMLTADGPKVIEYNCRFGDPETQVVLPLLKTDLLTVMRAVTEERLSEIKVEFSNQNAACIVIASKGYPSAYQKGFPITVPQSVLPHVYFAGAAEKDGQLVTSGGRVLGVTAVADTLEAALHDAYEMAGRISFEGAWYRRDIGARALAWKEN